MPILFSGAKDILAEVMSENAELRKILRKIIFKTGIIHSTMKNKSENHAYEMYTDYREPVIKIPPHRILAINRGEKASYLKIEIEIETEQIFEIIKQKYLTNNQSIFLI